MTILVAKLSEVSSEEHTRQKSLKDDKIENSDMITPQFTLSQTDTHLLIEIRTPHIKTQDFSIFVEDNLFILSVTPYYLRLTLPGNVVEDDESSAKYDIASGILLISLSKVNTGEEFPDLDLTNRLLARTGEIVDDKGQVKGPPRIQVMDTLPSEDPWANGVYDEALLFDFQLPQTLTDTYETAAGSKYGFNNQYSGHFLHIQNPDVLTILDAEQKTDLERWQVMRHQEDEKFDRDWYLADLFDPPDELTEALKYKLPVGLNDSFSAEEQLSLRNIGNKDFLIDNQKDVYLNLPPLLFAILYDQCTTLSCPTPESPWTISRTSPSLSSLAPVYLPPTASVPFSQLPPIKQIKIALFRRALTYPLYRTRSLAEKLWNDIAQCLAMGKRAVLRLLLSARSIFMDGGDWSVYSRIIWEDYIIWCQASRESVLKVLAEEMQKIVLKPGEIGFGLEEVENEIQDTAN